MGWTSIIIGLFLAGCILATIPKVPGRGLQGLVAGLAGLVLLFGIFFSSMRYVSADRIGIVSKNAFGPNLPPGAVIASEGEMGTQAAILAPGWKFGYWPIIYDVHLVPLVEIDADSVGIVKAIDGNPLAAGQLYADEMETSRFRELLEDPVAFLAPGGGQKGVQTNVLTPGQHRINTELFEIEIVPQTVVNAGTVAVLKANAGTPPSIKQGGLGDGSETIFLAAEGEKGVRADPLLPGKFPINTKAFTVYSVSTEQRVAQYTERSESDGPTFGPIKVKSSDGFNFPVDVRVVYKIKANDAPTVVALLGGDNQRLQELLTSRVRSIFRDNAESVKALDYVQQRSTQSQKSAQMLRDAMTRFGVTIESIDIGDVGSEDTLGELLQTQKDREIAIQQQITFQEQQRAAEQEKELTRTKQEAEEEKRLATARYQVQIAEQEKQQRIIQANAEAEAIEIRAKAQADAYNLIAQQIGPANAAMIELLKIVGEQGVNITPRVMISGMPQNGGGTDPQTAALIGTMLDRMVSDPGEDDAERRREVTATGSNR